MERYIAKKENGWDWILYNKMGVERGGGEAEEGCKEPKWVDAVQYSLKLNWRYARRSMKSTEKKAKAMWQIVRREKELADGGKRERLRGQRRELKQRRRWKSESVGYKD